MPGALAQMTNGHQPTLSFSGKIDFCRGYPGSCWFDMASHRAEIAELRRANQELYLRYLHLHTLAAYEETGRASIIGSVPMVPADLSRLFRASVAAQALSAHTTVERRLALDGLNHDVAMWRRVMVGNGPLVSKLVAQNMVCQDFALLADMLSDRDFNVESVAPEVHRILAAVKLADWKIGGALANEFRNTDTIWQQMGGSARDGSLFTKARGWPTDQPWWAPAASRVISVLLKPEATRNLNARLTRQLERVAEAPPGELLQSIAQFHHWEETEAFAWWRYPYNPVGRFLAQMPEDVYDSYFMRVYDRAAYQSLVQLMLSARLAGVHGVEVQTFAAEHPEMSRHPASGKPAIWDSKLRTLSLQPLDSRGNLRPTVRTWPQEGRS